MKIAIARIINKRTSASTEWRIQEEKAWCVESIMLRAKMSKLQIDQDNIKYAIEEVDKDDLKLTAEYKLSRAECAHVMKTFSDDELMKTWGELKDRILAKGVGEPQEREDLMLLRQEIDKRHGEKRPLTSVNFADYLTD